MPSEMDVSTGHFLGIGTEAARVYWIDPKLTRGTKHEAVGKTRSKNVCKSGAIIEKYYCCVAFVESNVMSIATRDVSNYKVYTLTPKTCTAIGGHRDGQRLRE